MRSPPRGRSRSLPRGSARTPSPDVTAVVVSVPRRFAVPTDAPAGVPNAPRTRPCPNHSAGTLHPDCAFCPYSQEWELDSSGSDTSADTALSDGADVEAFIQYHGALGRKYRKKYNAATNNVAVEKRDRARSDYLLAKAKHHEKLCSAVATPHYARRPLPAWYADKTPPAGPVNPRKTRPRRDEATPRAATSRRAPSPPRLAARLTSPPLPLAQRIADPPSGHRGRGYTGHHQQQSHDPTTRRRPEHKFLPLPSVDDYPPGLEFLRAPGHEGPLEDVKHLRMPVTMDEARQLMAEAQREDQYLALQFFGKVLRLATQSTPGVPHEIVRGLKLYKWERPAWKTTRRPTNDNPPPMTTSAADTDDQQQAMDERPDAIRPDDADNANIMTTSVPEVLGSPMCTDDDDATAPVSANPSATIDDAPAQAAAGPASMAVDSAPTVASAAVSNQHAPLFTKRNGMAVSGWLLERDIWPPGTWLPLKQPNGDLVKTFVHAPMQGALILIELADCHRDPERAVQFLQLLQPHVIDFWRERTVTLPDEPWPIGELSDTAVREWYKRFDQLQQDTTIPDTASSDVKDVGIYLDNVFSSGVLVGLPPEALSHHPSAPPPP